MSNYQPRVFGPYTLVDRIASGGMAEIFLARTSGYSGFEKTVVIKRLHPHFSDDSRYVEMLVDEAKIAVQLQHVNIAQILDLGCVDGQYYIAMEWVDGRDLFAVLRELHDRNLNLPCEAAAFLAMEVCHGLHYAHTYRHRLTGEPLEVVHRDISPQNLLVSWSGEVKITDFGIVQARKRITHTQAGVIKGKFYYMSPEQALGQPVDHCSDIFSAGIVLWEALTATPLYDEVDEASLIRHVQAAAVTPPREIRPDVPAALNDICMKALSKEPGERWTTARDMSQALAQFLSQCPQPFTKLELGECLKALFTARDTAQASPDAGELQTETPSTAPKTEPPISFEKAQPEMTRPLRPLGSPKPVSPDGASDNSHASPEIAERTNGPDPHAQTRRLSLEDILEASSQIAAKRLQPSTNLSKTTAQEPTFNTPVEANDPLGRRLKTAITVAVVIDVVLALTILWLLATPIPANSAHSTPPAAVGESVTTPTPAGEPESTAAADESEPKKAITASAPAPSPHVMQDQLPAEIVVVRPENTERIRLYLNGQLFNLEGDRLSVPSGRYSVRARLLPSGKLTPEQVVVLTPGSKKRITF